MCLSAQVRTEVLFICLSTYFITYTIIIAKLKHFVKKKMVMSKVVKLLLRYRYLSCCDLSLPENSGTYACSLRKIKRCRRCPC